MRGIGSYFDENVHHCVLCKIKYPQVYSFDLVPLKMLFLTKITIWSWMKTSSDFQQKTVTKGVISFELESELMSLIFKMVNFLYWELLSPFFQVLLKKSLHTVRKRQYCNLHLLALYLRCLKLQNSINWQITNETNHLLGLEFFLSRKMP